MQYQEYYKTLYDLQADKITNVLFISSPYEAFIFEEDGALSESVIQTYSELNFNLSFSPRITYATTEKRALNLLEKRKYDLVVNTLNLSGIDNERFCKTLKERFPRIPIVILSSSKTKILKPIEAYIDGAFLWQGNPKIFFAITKLVEDMLNVERDVKLAGVKVILVVEDSIEYYSLFLPKLYREIMLQTQRLISSGVTPMRRLFKARSRPKILLARNYKEAMRIAKKYKKDLIGLISDIGFPVNGYLDHGAGFLLAKKLREMIPDLPIILNSSDSSNRTKTELEGFTFLDKNSPILLEELELFIKENLGFGDFVFRLPSGEEVGRASDLLQLADEIARVPEESLIYHSTRNHFSIWLMARGEFLLANTIRPQKIENFSNIPNMKGFLIESVRSYLAGFQSSVVADINQTDSERSYNFLRLAGGLLGGKAMGLAFVNYAKSLDSFKKFADKFPSIQVKTPKTRVIATDEFDYFVEHNGLGELFEKQFSDEQVIKRVLRAKLSVELVSKLGIFLNELDSPIAVRSSSLLEDSATQAFAGIYATYMLPNNENSFEARLNNLRRAIKFVYASVFFKKARMYAENSSQKIEKEKMSVILQEVIGAVHDNLFFPDISGVLKTFNFFPPQGVRKTDGVVYLALGLGKTVTDGGDSLSIYPKKEGILAQFNAVDTALRTTQRYFYALDLNATANLDLKHHSEDVNLSLEPIRKAEGLLPYFYRFASTYVANDNRIKPGVFHEGARIISFYELLRSEDFPVYDFMKELMKLAKSWFGTDVEIEFAINLDHNKKKHEFYLLQIRPMVNNFVYDIVDTEINIDTVLLESNKILGNMYVDDIDYVVYVKEDNYSNLNNRAIAKEIAEINAQLDKKAVFMAFGRWGSSDEFLGVPVEWENISNALALVELNRDDFMVDLSYASHFFHNISSMNISYIAIDFAKRHSKVDWEAIHREELVLKELNYVRLVRFNKKLKLMVDAKKEKAKLFLS